ncbi:MAG: glycosyltransferase family 2 protein [bacterium]|nr:glycosyltransferase family 2 protein [bacterium]
MLSVVVIAKNEEDELGKCLASVPKEAEKIVIDDESTDRTVEVAKSLGAVAYPHRLENFASQQNYGLEKASGPWVLFLDADEALSSQLQREIEERLSAHPSVVGYYLRRRTIFLGRPINWGEFREQRILKLVNKNAHPRWERPVHEVLQVSGTIGILDGALWHNPHRNLGEFVAKINRYTEMEMQVQPTRGTPWCEIVFYPIGKFVVNYFFRLGFLDGVRGLILAVMMSYHSFLKRAKIWSRSVG